jgi:hypothetical protein
MSLSSVKPDRLLERQLFRLCNSALGAGPECAAIIYYRTPTLDSRIDLVTELIRTKLPRRKKADGGHDHPLVTEWTTIIKDVKALLQTRNFIAHQPHKETEHWVWTDEESGEATSWVEIYRNFHERLRKKSKKTAIMAYSLPSHHAQLLKVTSDLSKFHDKIHPEQL